MVTESEGHRPEDADHITKVGPCMHGPWPRLVHLFSYLFVAVVIFVCCFSLRCKAVRVPRMVALSPAPLCVHRGAGSVRWEKRDGKFPNTSGSASAVRAPLHAKA